MEWRTVVSIARPRGPGKVYGDVLLTKVRPCESVCLPSSSGLGRSTVGWSRGTRGDDGHSSNRWIARLVGTRYLYR